MENLNENTNNPKQRHGCVTAWLILIIIGSSLSALIYLFAEDMVAQSFPNGISSSMLILLALLGVGNVIFAILLFKWKKIGFWGIVLTNLIGVFVNLNVGLSIGQSLVGLLGLGILFGVLQIKKEDVSAWGNLD